jgi:hypothetical protein
METSRTNPYDVSVTRTTARQTPNNDFGQVLERTARRAAAIGAALAPSVGGGVASAAAGVLHHGASLVADAAAGSRSAAGASGAGASGAGEAGGAEGRQGGQWELLEAQRLMAEEGQAFNAQYLQLQNAMQQESREFNAVSNIMKVRHDSAKAAINNIR